jgi:putative ABC transport system permease protein
LGVAVAEAILAVFVHTAPIDIPRLDEVVVDGRVLGFAAAIGVITGLLVAVLPARRGTTGDVQAVLRGGGAAVASERGGLRARQLLLTLQVTMSMALMVVTALIGTSLLRVLSVERGFDEERVITIPISLPAARYSEAVTRVATYDRLLSGIQSVPGVRSVTLTSLLPMQGEGQVNFIVADGVKVPRSEQPSANFRFVAPAFFETLGIAIQRGRSFTFDERHEDRPTPAVISEPVARRLWPGQDALGKRFSRGISEEPGFEVVGIATDARYTSLDRTPPLMVYVPYWWRSRASTSVLVNTSADAQAVMPAIGRALRVIDPEIAIGQMRPLTALVDAAVAGRRYQAELFLLFGAVALVITSLGVYAVTAYGISHRRREMNIRVALGANHAGVIRLILRQSAVPIVAGVALGAMVALGLAGVLTSLLYEVRPRDPMITATMAGFVGMVGVLTSLVATRRGLAIDPMAALRED